MNSLAVITARGGSKRIPGKNTKDFCGKPIIAYSILAACESGLFDEVMVSTDSANIKEVALQYGAAVPFFRSEKNSDDYATTADVLIEVIKRYEALGISYENICCIYPTAPFVTAKKLFDAKSALEKDDYCKVVFAATSFSYPPQRGLIEKDGLAHWWQPKHSESRSQDLPVVYHDAGQFYFFKTRDFLDNPVLIGNRSKMLMVPETEVQDIDNLTDWEIAEVKYERMMAQNGQAGAEIS